MQSSWAGAPPPTASEAQLADYLKRLCSDVTLVSNKDGYFVHWLHQISAYISEDFVHRFAELTTDYERIQMAWKIKPLHSLKVTRFFKAKDEEASFKRRQDGNAAFQKKALRQALQCYCQAVTRAPHTGSSLALAFANRSAALSQLEEYRWCLRDARLALVHGYPVDLRYKILERAGHCYQKLADPSRALGCYELALQALKSSGLAEDKLRSWTHSLRQKLEECAKDLSLLGTVEEHIGDALLDDPENCRVTDWKGVGEPAPAPRLYLGTNPALPSASAAVTLTSSKDAGRCAVAVEQVPAGEVLVSEAPHAAVLAKDKTGAYCSHCCRRLLASVPCPTCCGVAYCSAHCCQQATVYHRWECPYLDLLHASGMSLNGYLALRIITQRPLAYFLELRPHLAASGPLRRSSSPSESDESATKGNRCQPSTGCPLFVPSAQHPHDPSSYLSVYRLVGLEEQREPLDFLQRTLMAILLLKVLQRTGYFGPWNDEAPPDADASDEQLYVGGLLLRNLQLLQFNAHEVSGMTFLSDPPTFKRSKSLYLGLAVYPTVAFFNHSCFPAVTRYFLGTRMVVCSIRGVGRGEPLSENYGPIFTHHTKAERQRKLLSRYWFNCACEACSSNWGTYPELRAPMRLRCPNCSAPVTEPLEGGTSPVSPVNQKLHVKMTSSVKCRECSKPMPFEQMTADMVLAQKLYVSGQDHLHAGRRESAIFDLTRFVSTSQQHVMLPHKDVHMAMQTLRLLVAARGTCALVLAQDNS